jgi:hypothetical protein
MREAETQPENLRDLCKHTPSHKHTYTNTTQTSIQIHGDNTIQE